MNSEKTIERLSAAQRLAHAVIATSIVILIITGFPIMFMEHLRWVATLFGGFGTTMLLHRIAAFALILMSIYYGTYYLLCILTRKSSVGAILFGLDDLRDFFQDVKFGLKMSDEEPRYSKFNWIMKMSIGFVVFEVFVFIVTGLILWFPWYFLEIWPRNYMAAVVTIHGAFAIMALLHFTAHSFGNHFYPGKFPLNRVIFTGRISEKDAKREFPLWYEQIKK